MENALMVASLLMSVLKSDMEIWYVVTLILLSISCSIVQTIQLESSSNWRNATQCGVGLQYGCVLYPLLICYSENSFDNINTITAVMCALISVGLVIVFSNVHHLLKFVVMLFVIALVITCIYKLVMFYNHMAHLLLLYKIIAYLLLVYLCFQACSGSFSIGEAILSSQMTASMATFYFIFSNDASSNVVDICSSCGNIIMLFVVVCLLGFIFIPSNVLGHTVIFYIIACIFALCVFYNNLFVEYAVYIYQFLQQNKPFRFLLVAYWVTVTLICIFYVSVRNSMHSASTAERKLFHIFILLVYIPGLMYDIPLLFFCSAIACCLFVVIGVMHAFNIKPFGVMLVKALDSFKSKQDTGKYILTPVYLILGLSFPIWMQCAKKPQLLYNLTTSTPIECYSGILSVGIGDAVASVIGSKYGSVQLYGNLKTAEGTLGSILIQLLVISILKYSNCIEATSSFSIFAISLTALVEAYTDQIDNIVLPLVMYLLLL